MFFIIWAVCVESMSRIDPVQYSNVARTKVGDCSHAQTRKMSNFFRPHTLMHIQNSDRTLATTASILASKATNANAMQSINTDNLIAIQTTYTCRVQPNQTDQPPTPSCVRAVWVAQTGLQKP